MKTVHRWATAVSLTAAAALVVAGCGTAGGANNGAVASGTSNAASANTAEPGSSAAAGGTAFVAYAGSLQLANDQYVGPAFTKATGIKYQGQGNGALAQAQLIASNEVTPNVFMSIGTAPIQVIDPKFTTWSVGFASSPIVIAYSPQSPYASQLHAIAKGREPLTKLFSLMEQPNFHLGRTDPNIDPQGQAFIFMLRLAEQELHLQKGTAQKILGSVNNPKQIFSETSILSRLQAGQLDASSAYLPEAVERKLPYITLPNTINLGDPADASLYATQSLKIAGGKVAKGAPIEVYISALKGTPDTAAGEAFVKFALSPAAQALYKQQGYTLTKPLVFGAQSDIPAPIAQEIAKLKAQ